MADSISLDKLDLKKEVNAVLLAYGMQVDDALQASIDTVSKEAVKRLKTVSLAHGWRKYSSAWKYDRKGGKQAKGAVIYNGKYGPLTHLLENGHEIISHGQSTGQRTRAFPHIAQVDAYVAQELPKEVEKAIQEIK